MLVCPHPSQVSVFEAIQFLHFWPISGRRCLIYMLTMVAMYVMLHWCELNSVYYQWYYRILRKFACFLSLFCSVLEVFFSPSDVCLYTSLITIYTGNSVVNAYILGYCTLLYALLSANGNSNLIL